MMIEPRDHYNTVLFNNVHPPDWDNPRPSGPYNLVVVGGGTAGLVSAAIAASLGASTALVERGMMGGDCLNVGCVPSKGVIRGARAAAELTWLHREGLLHGDTTSGHDDRAGRADRVSFTAVMERMRRIRSEISGHDSPARFRDEFGVDVYVGTGAFTGRRSLRVTGDDGDTRELNFSRAVIATGARASAPPISGIDQVPYLTNETIFSLTDPPGHLVVIGAGPIGCEMAQSFAKLGSEVTLLEMAPRVLPREDRDASRVLQKRLAVDGVTLRLGVQVTAVERAARDRDSQTAPPEPMSLQPSGVHPVLVNYREPDGTESSTRGTHLLVAIGRAPNLDGLNLEAAGVTYARGGVPVDDHLRTSNRKVYAAGDVAVPPEGTAPMLFTHTAEATAGIAVQNALYLNTSRVSRLVVPWTTYTTPEVAQVGITQETAESRGLAVDVFQHPMIKVDRARLDGETEGFVKLITKRGGRKILGATVVGAHAGETIAEVVLAMKHNLGVDALTSVIHPYPTQSEAVKRAATGYLKQKLTPRVERLMAAWFRWRR